MDGEICDTCLKDFPSRCKSEMWSGPVGGSRGGVSVVVTGSTLASMIPQFSPSFSSDLGRSCLGLMLSPAHQHQPLSSCRRSSVHMPSDCQARGEWGRLSNQSPEAEVGGVERSCNPAQLCRWTLETHLGSGSPPSPGHPPCSLGLPVPPLGLP